MVRVHFYGVLDKICVLNPKTVITFANLLYCCLLRKGFLLANRYTLVLHVAFSLWMCTKTSVESIISMQSSLLFLCMMKKPQIKTLGTRKVFVRSKSWNQWRSDYSVKNGWKRLNNPHWPEGLWNAQGHWASLRSNGDLEHISVAGPSKPFNCWWIVPTPLPLKTVLTGRLPSSLWWQYRKVWRRTTPVHK